ncbi:MAG: type IX secretion system sortase PorU, partial [Prolixibacteraceae bacterium]|nr:type IX secretion system sortase PorU [Prolixibacteraceae bacterium]
MKKFSIVIVIFLFAFTSGDVKVFFREINWEFNKTIGFDGTKTEFPLFFEGCDFDDSKLPVYLENIKIEKGSTQVVIENTIFKEFTDVSGKIDRDEIPEKLELSQNIVTSKEDKFLNFKIIPLIKKGDRIFILQNFTFKLVPQKSEIVIKSAKNFISESVLKNGFWVKVSTTKKGIHRVPYSKLQEWGFSSPGNVKVFGNGGFVLSENVDNEIKTDLEQVAVWKGKDGSGNDCLFFYSPGNTKWEWNPAAQSFDHKINIYSKSAFYYLSEDQGSDKNVSLLPEVVDAANITVQDFNEYTKYEQEKVNLINSGQQWYGERFINGISQAFDIACPGRVAGTAASIKINAAGRSSAASKLRVTVNDSQNEYIDFNAVNTGDLTSLYADQATESFETELAGEDMEIRLAYLASNSSSEAWLDYIVMQYKRKLAYISNELYFRDPESVGYGNIEQFEITNVSSGLKVFDVSELYDIYDVPVTLNGTLLSFKRPASNLREYVVFNPVSDFTIPEYVGEVPNQNLHGISVPEMIVISHPDYYSIASELADFHRNNDGMSVEVVKTTEVYNEFSSGMPDVSGIRNFIKMLYDKDRNTLKYVLLFGDGSYDNRNLKGSNHNFIPTYQSANSLSPTSSFVTDDFYVLMDQGETVKSGAVDLGIGRIPASTVYEAQVVLDKVKNYNSPEALGTWRNIVCFIADDQDGNTHMNDSETLANKVNSEHGAFVTSKIYFDAYPQETTPGGERYPEVTESINNQVREGVLILNYIGHANDRFMADEHVLDVSNISSWSNHDNLPIFVTATCEFSRYDSDETSAGEYVLLNPNGGGIGLFSTTRVVYAYSNFLLSRSFYNHVFNQDENGNHYRMGDIIRLAKNGTPGDTNKRNFSLLADPALRLSYPKYRIITSKINQQDATGTADTIKALNMITIEGYIADYFGNILDDFHGEISPVVYDKAFMLNTLGNGGETPFEFKVQNNIIYKGLASVTNGHFTFSFIVPKDIAYNLGQGKIIYYARNSEEDAHGSFENFLIGGSNEGGVNDTNGPQVDLYLDNESFRSGDETSKNPLLLAYVSDENGINTVGTGIGHDITAVIDGNMSNVIILNDYYEAAIDDYTSGKIEFPISGLSEGKHTLKLKVWDVANNSTEVEIEFVVTGDFIIQTIGNYPNPVTEFTYFTFEHNQPDASFDGMVE